MGFHCRNAARGVLFLRRNFLIILYAIRGGTVPTAVFSRILSCLIVVNQERSRSKETETTVIAYG